MNMNRVNIMVYNFQRQMIEEMKQQKAEQSIIKWAVMSLQTKQQVEKMMEYLLSIRNKKEPKGKVIEMIDKISKN